MLTPQDFRNDLDRYLLNADSPHETRDRAYNILSEATASVLDSPTHFPPNFISVATRLHSLLATISANAT